MDRIGASFPIQRVGLVKPAKVPELVSFLTHPRAFFHEGRKACSNQVMRETYLTMPEIALIAGTRVALGVGLGFLCSEKLSTDQRRGAGWALFGIGVVSSIPLIIDVLGKRTANNKPITLAA